MSASNAVEHRPVWYLEPHLERVTFRPTLRRTYKTYANLLIPCSKVSETTELRNDLSSSMFLLSAFYENVHQTVKANVGGKGGNVSRKGTHAYNLEKARQALFGKLVIVLNNLRTNSEFSQFQLRIGGKFPRQEYLA